MKLIPAISLVLSQLIRCQTGDPDHVPILDDFEIVGPSLLSDQGAFSEHVPGSFEELEEGHNIIHESSIIPNYFDEYPKRKGQHEDSVSTESAENDSQVISNYFNEYSKKKSQDEDTVSTESTNTEREQDSLYRLRNHILLESHKIELTTEELDEWNKPYQQQKVDSILLHPKLNGLSDQEWVERYTPMNMGFCSDIEMKRINYIQDYETLARNDIIGPVTVGPVYAGMDAELLFRGTLETPIQKGSTIYIKYSKLFPPFQDDLCKYIDEGHLQNKNHYKCGDEASYSRITIALAVKMPGGLLARFMKRNWSLKVWATNEDGSPIICFSGVVPVR